MSFRWLRRGPEEYSISYFLLPPMHFSYSAKWNQSFLGIPALFLRIHFVRELKHIPCSQYVADFGLHLSQFAVLRQSLHAERPGLERCRRRRQDTDAGNTLQPDNFVKIGLAGNNFGGLPGLDGDNGGLGRQSA